MKRSNHLITLGVLAAAFVVLLGTGFGQVLFALLVFIGHFVGYALWQTETPTWWSLLFPFLVLVMPFLALRRWAIRKYVPLR